MPNTQEGKEIILSSQPKISVIIPVYGVEKYIERCARSLFEQTLDNIEYIFIDDCTPDRSIDVLRRVIEDYPIRKTQVQIHRMPQNSKQAAARNEGLKYATGQYITHCDPDDWCELALYSELYAEAERTKSDIVCCDYMTHTLNGDGYTKVNDCIDPRMYIKTAGYDTPWMLWNRIVKADLIKRKGISFFRDINFMEDQGFLIRCYHHANKVIVVHQYLYHHVNDNPSSISNLETDMKKNIQRENLVRELENYFGEKAMEYRQYFDTRKFIVKDNIMRSGNISLWRTTFPEMNNLYLSSPYFHQSPLYRIFCFLAVHHITFPMKLARWIKKVGRNINNL